MDSDRSGGAKWRRVALIALLLLFNISVGVLVAANVSVIAPTNHLDGAFQTSNGLIRIAQGEAPGRDFFPYLGIGPIYVLFPLFFVLGGTTSAAVFSSQFAVMIALQLVAVSIGLFITRRTTLLFATSVAAVATVGILLVVQTTPLWQGTALDGPLGALSIAAGSGNSLRPIRALAPILLALIALVALASRRRSRTQAAVIGASAGIVAAIWSNDFALVPAVLLLMTVTALKLFAPRWRIRDLAVMWLTAVLACVVAGFVATAGSFIAYESYNYSDVLSTQAWYFGPWARNTRVFSVADFLAALSTTGALVPFVILVTVIVIALVKRERFSVLLAYSGGALFAGGCTGIIGGHVDLYFTHFQVWAILTAIGAVTHLVARAVVSAATRHPALPLSRLIRKSSIPGTAILVIAAVVTTANSATTFQTTKTYAEESGYFVWTPEFGAYLDKAFINHMDVTAPAGGDLIEEYAGLSTAAYGATPSSIDSVIHALGSKRAVFEDVVESQPSQIITTAPQLSIEWVTWNVSANWWFYRHLFKSYAPVQTSPTTLDWTPAAPQVWPDVPGCTVDEDGTVAFTAPVDGLYEITLDYIGPGSRSRAFTEVQNKINVAMGSDGYVALDPGATSQSYPTYAPHGLATLSSYDVSGSSDRLTKFAGCSVKRIVPPSRSGVSAVLCSIFTHCSTPAPVTDENWNQGVSTGTRAAVIIEATAALVAEAKASDSVQFANGETRQISHVDQASVPGYVVLRLDGDPLASDQVGSSHPFVFLSTSPA